MIKFIILCLLFVSVSASSQDKLVKYYDSLWTPVSKENAFYYTELTKVDTLYHRVAYWTKTNKLISKSVFADTLLLKPRGHTIKYFESGQVEDSAYFHESGELKEIYHYYPSGQLRAHYTYDNRSKKEVSIGYDEKGKVIKDFIYLRDAEFPGGETAWKEFIGLNIKTNVPIKNKAPEGDYQVIIGFAVNENGRVVDIRPLTNFGYGMEEEAIRVLRKAPRWMPLIYLGEKKKAYRRQPITFSVENAR